MPSVIMKNGRADGRNDPRYRVPPCKHRGFSTPGTGWPPVNTRGVLRARVRLWGMFLAALASGLILATGLLNPNPPQASAVSSSTINFQARLLSISGNIVPDGNYHVEFKLFNASSSSGSSQGSCSGDANCLWVETRTTGNLVRVVNGYLTVNLGSVTAFASTINWDQ